jgi:hypothetical protein
MPALVDPIRLVAVADAVVLVSGVVCIIAGARAQ